MSDAILPTWTEPRASHRPAILRGRSFLRSGSAIVVLAALLVAVLGLVASRLSSPVVPHVLPPVAPPVWIDIIKPVRIYSLEAREFAKSSSSYTARRRSAGLAREDVLTFGAWRPDQPSLRLRILRNGAESVVPLDTAIVRQAADVGLAVGRSTLPDLLPTRFGRFEIANVSVTGGEAKRQCSGFRLRLASPTLDIDGFACGADSRPLDRAALSCLVDRLDLASAGEDRALGDFFAATDLRRNVQCDGMRLGPDALHAAWLDEKDAPAPQVASRRKRRH